MYSLYLTGNEFSLLPFCRFALLCPFALLRPPLPLCPFAPLPFCPFAPLSLFSLCPYKFCLSVRNFPTSRCYSKVLLMGSEFPQQPVLFISSAYAFRVLPPADGIHKFCLWVRNFPRQSMFFLSSAYGLWAPNFPANALHKFCLWVRHFPSSRCSS